MSDRNSDRKGVQPNVKRADPETTDGAIGGVENEEATQSDQTQPTAAEALNEKREAELVKKMPKHTEPAQERGERHETAKAIASAGKQAEPPKQG